MTTILIIVILILAMWHYVVQAIIIPNYTHDTKYRLYAERDKLRRLFIENKISKTEFIALDEFISNMLFVFKNLSLFDILVNFKKISSLHEGVIHDKLEIINDCKDIEYTKIKDMSFAISLSSTIVNSIGWTPYIIIPTIFYALYKKVIKNTKIRSEITAKSNDLVFMGENGLTVC